MTGNPVWTIFYLMRIGGVKLHKISFSSLKTIFESKQETRCFVSRLPFINIPHHFIVYGYKCGKYNFAFKGKLG